MNFFKKTTLSLLAVPLLLSNFDVSSVSAASNESFSDDGRNQVILEMPVPNILDMFEPIPNKDSSISILSEPVKMHPGVGATYNLIGTFSGSSYKVDKLKELATRLTINLVDYKLHPLTVVFTNSLFDTFYSGPATKYYVTKQYLRVFNGKSYAKIVTETYSNSARTKLISRDEFVSVVPM